MQQKCRGMNILRARELGRAWYLADIQTMAMVSNRWQILYTGPKSRRLQDSAVQVYTTR